MDKLRRNMSLPDMNAEYSRDTSESTAPRAASPVNQLPGQATNRSNSRPRMQPHHFVTTAMSGEPITASDLDGDASSEQKGVSDKEQDPRPPTPQRSPSRLKRSHTHNQSQGDLLAVHSQSSGHLTKHQVLSEESLPGSTESRPPVGNKDLPPIPKGQAPAFQLCTRVRRKTEGGDSDTITSPVLLTSPVRLTPPVLPASSDTLKRKESSKGLIPQDVLKNMDPKDVQKAIKGTVVTSRVYKVMSPEQLDNLKKEQDDLEHFIETMNVSLHIESRMRDASHSLIRLHENNSNMDAVKAATAQLHATTRKMDQIVQKTQEAMWRVMAIQRLLLQHESAILNAGLRRLDNENRELSRTIMQLDTARDQEKEEKIKWKKEHNRLKFQSILFPPTPILEEFQTNSSSSSNSSEQTSQKTLAHLESMEQYVKELNDEILQKEEQLAEAKNQLQAVKGWADDFQVSILNRKPSPSEGHQPNSNADLQEQLRELQTTVESELKDMDVHVQEIKSKVDVLLEENSVLVSKTKADDDQRLNRRHRPSVRARTHARQGSDLQMVLRESLMELDRQIRQDGVQSVSSSRPSSSSTSTTSISVDSLNALSRNTSNRSCGSPLSRSHSSSSDTALSGDAVQNDVPQVEVEVQELAVSSSDEDTPAEDASEEIRRLSTMVLEMQQIVKTLSE
ncbi:MAG: Up-regulated during septation-domain-containing protein [Benniella sp.]|nr:MAG: Up-regulated during septation-domain-containing protein [Benniella sp.]